MAAWEEFFPQPECAACILPQKNLDDCYNEAMEKLKSAGKLEKVTNDLLSCKTNYDRLLYTYRLLRDLELFPMVRRNIKNNDVAMYYRCQGNEYFKHMRYCESVQYYNLSMLYATSETEHLVIAVSNRSAAFFSMGKYKECMTDIEFVLNTAYPVKLREKLIDRKQKCLDELKTMHRSKKDPNDSKIAEILRINGQKDNKYLCASAKLKVIYTKEMGRHVIANEDINVGEVLAQEDPYLTVLLQSQFLFCCAHCLSRKLNLYPCLNCTFALYCSLDCRDTAFKEYHKIECELNSALIEMEFSKMELLALKTVIRSETDKKNWNEAIRIVEIAESRVNTELWGCVKVNNKWVYDSKHYSAIHTLATNVDKRSGSDLFRKSITAALLFRFLATIKYMQYTTAEELEKVKKYVGHTLLTHLMTSPTNMHSISSITQNADGNYIDELDIACGAYAFHSLINHSCFPNVVRYTKLGTGKMSLIAIRPIKKGMQIFDNYGYHHAVHTRKERQSSLEFQYKFNCACEACVNNWPVHEKLKSAVGVSAGVLRKKDQVLSPRVIEKLMKADKATALKCYKPLCELINLLDPYAPCKELSECQESLKQCLVIFHGVVSYVKEIPFSARPPCKSETPQHHYFHLSRPIPDFDEYME